MAENVLKLRVDSNEFDSKIKHAAQGIQAFAQKCRESGQGVSSADKEVMNFVQALGKMDTVSTTTKQQLREMSNALTTLTMTYRSLTDEEKASPFGQELSKGIQMLTERAGQAQDAMDDVQKSIKNASSDTRAFDQLAQGATLMTSSFQVLNGTMKMFGIEVGDNVQFIATLQAAMAVTNGLTQMQTVLQKESALMQGVQAAQASLAAAAQKLFAAATGDATVAQSAFNLVAKANPYVILATIAAAAAAAIWGFSEATEAADEDIEEMGKSAEEAEKKIKAYKDTIANAAMSAMETASQIDFLRTEYAKANDEISKNHILEQAAEKFRKLGLECKGVSDAQTLLVNNGQKIVQMLELQGNAAALSALRMEAFKKSFRMILENQGGSNDLHYAYQIAKGSSAVHNYDQMLSDINGQIATIQSSLPMSNGGGRTGGRTGGSSGGDTTKTPNVTAIYTESQTELQLLEQQLQNAIAIRDTYGKASQEWQEMNASAEELQRQIDEMNGVKPDGPLVQMEKAAQELQELMKNPASAEEYRALAEDLRAVNKEIADFKGENKGDDKKKKEVNVTQEIGKMAGGISSMVSGIENLGIEIPQGMKDVLGGIQSVISVLTAITTIVTAIQALTTADVLLPFPFAKGGIINAAGGTLVGNSYSGDNLRGIGPGGQLYGLNAGEVVLNRAEQGVIANALQESGGLHVTGVLRGEDLMISIDRTGRRQGKGELCFFK